MLHNSTPEFYERHLREAIQRVNRKLADHRMISIRSWNEWAEGNYLEPDLKFGYSYLEVTRRAVNATSGNVRWDTWIGHVEAMGIRHQIGGVFGLLREAAGAESGEQSSDRTCPICGWEGATFLPCNMDFAHDDSRQLASNCKCPQCESHHRHRGFMLILREFDLPEPGVKMLHVAPENFMADYFQQRSGQYIKIDKHLEQFRTDDITEMDLTELTYPDCSFDFVFCSHVLEHIPDDRKAIDEIYRVLTPGGLAMLMVPVYPLEITADLYPKSPDIQTHVHQPGLDYFHRYEDAGFSVSVHYPEQLFDREKYGLRTGWDPVALCRKQ